MNALRAAALAGVDVVQLPLVMVVDPLQDGSLVRVLPGWEPRAELIPAVFPSRRGLLPSLRALLDHLAPSFSEIVETADQSVVDIERALLGTGPED
ncbi:MAG: LysR substrate-binding domain-containing protein [Porticoccaceae bacterium]